MVRARCALFRPQIGFWHLLHFERPVSPHPALSLGERAGVRGNWLPNKTGSQKQLLPTDSTGEHAPKARRISAQGVAPGLIGPHAVGVQNVQSDFLLSFDRYRTIHLLMLHEAGIWDGREFQRKVLA